MSRGKFDVTEPYFLMNSAHNGRGITHQFDVSCSTFGATSYFYTKMNSSSNSGLSDGAKAGIAIGGFALIVGVIFIGYMIMKERRFVKSLIYVVVFMKL